MNTSEILGTIYIMNIANYEPFTINYSEIDNNTIQVDITGVGCVNFLENIGDELLLEINTNINNHLKEYADLTGHKSDEIGYTLNLSQTNKLNRKYNTFETSINASLVFNKPIESVSSYSLEPTIRLLSSIILSEAFILRESDGIS